MTGRAHLQDGHLRITTAMTQLTDSYIRRRSFRLKSDPSTTPRRSIIADIDHGVNADKPKTPGVLTAQPEKSDEEIADSDGQASKILKEV